MKNKKYTVSVGGTITGESVNGYYESGTVTDAEKLCTFTPISSITSITDTGEVEQKEVLMVALVDLEEKKEKIDGTKKQRKIKNSSTETTTKSKPK